jgi:hypothetical protein
MPFGAAPEAYVSALLFVQSRIGFIRRRLDFGALGFAQRSFLVSLSLFFLAPSTCRPRSLGSISSVIWLKCHHVPRWLITHLWPRPKPEFADQSRLAAELGSVRPAVVVALACYFRGNAAPTLRMTCSGNLTNTRADGVTLGNCDLNFLSVKAMTEIENVCGIPGTVDTPAENQCRIRAVVSPDPTIGTYTGFLRRGRSINGKTTD